MSAPLQSVQMKAIIPAAGFGTRMRPLTFTRPKPVLNVAGKPIIVHAIETLQAAGITEIGIVVSDVTRPAVSPTAHREAETAKAHRG